MWMLAAAAGIAGAAGVHLSYSQTSAPSPQPAQSAATAPSPATLPSTPSTTGLSEDKSAQLDTAKDLANLVLLWREMATLYETELAERNRSHAAEDRLLSEKEIEKIIQDRRDQGDITKGKYLTARGIIERLGKSGQLSAAEAEALRTELTILQKERGLVDLKKSPHKIGVETEDQYISRLREWENQEARNWRQSYTLQEAIKDRFEVLEALAKSERVRPEVCEILLGSVWPEAIKYERPSPGSLTGVPKKVDELLNKIEDRTQFGDNPLRRTPQWTRIAMAWRLAGPPAQHGWQQQEVIAQWYHEASEAADVLAKKGLLTAGEASLIKADANYQVDAHHMLTTDDLRAMLHKLEQTPAQASLLRLRRTMPALSRVVRDDTARPEYLEVVGRCAQTLRDDCREVAEADDLALNDEERMIAADILPQARGVLVEIEKAMKDSLAAKAHRLEERAAALEAQSKANELSPAGMAAKAKSLETEIEWLKSQAGPAGPVLAPEVERACRAARETASSLVQLSDHIATTRPARQDYDDLAHAWESLSNSDLYLYLHVRPEQPGLRELAMSQDSRRDLQQALNSLDQIERTRHLDPAEMDALRVGTLHATGRIGYVSFKDWPPVLGRLAKVQGVNPWVRDLVVSRASVDLCNVRNSEDDGADAKTYGLLNEILDRTPAGDTPLDQTPQWKQILFAWRFGVAAEKILAAEDLKGDAVRKRYLVSAVEHWYQQAIAAADELKAAGKLDTAEALLLRTEAKCRTGRRHYLLLDGPARISTGRSDSTEDSLLRVSLDIPAFRRLLRVNKVRQEVRDLVIDTFRNDCRIIGDPERLAQLSEIDRKAAQSVSKEASDILAQLEHPAASQPASAAKPGEPVDFDP